MSEAAATGLKHNDFGRGNGHPRTIEAKIANFVGAWSESKKVEAPPHFMCPSKIGRRNTIDAD